MSDLRNRLADLEQRIAARFPAERPASAGFDHAEYARLYHEHAAEFGSDGVEAAMKAALAETLAGGEA